MARYWVGGAGTWDATNTANWSATSGGAGGESVPTLNDDVFFDANSGAGTCTVGGFQPCRSLDFTGFTGTISSSAFGVNIYGSLVLSSTMTITGSSFIWQMAANTSGHTITSNGKTLTTNLIFGGLGGSWSLADALVCSGTITVTFGTFDTANYNVTAGSLSSNNSNTRTITLGSSTVTLSSALQTNTSTNLTFNGGTSQINLTGQSSALGGSGQTFYNVSFTSTAAASRTINGANTFNNLTLNASATGMSQLSISDNQTVNGTFTCAGSSATQRGFVRSNTLGTTRTITAAAVSADDCDFRDITIAGAAAPISPTRAGDCGGNSGITFPAAKTVYRVSASTAWTNTGSWSLTSGGTGDINNFPLPQDTIIINEDTALTGTLATGAYNIGAMDCSSRTTGITIDQGPITRYGSYILGSGVTVSGASAQTFSGRGTMVFTSAGKTITFPITVDAPGGIFQLGDAFSSSNTITLTQGTFDANDYNLTCTRFSSGNTNIRTLTMGSGLWTLSGTGTGTSSVWNLGTNISNLTFYKDTANIFFSDTSTTAREFRGSSLGLSYNKLTIGGATGTSVTTITGSNSFTELASTKTVAHTVRFNQNQGTIDTWSITGSAGNVVTVDSSAAGTRRTFNLTNVTSGIDYLNVKDIGVNQTDRFYVGTNSTDSGNNLNVIFTDPPGIAATGNMFMLFQ
jgi:hypothetical protein